MTAANQLRQYIIEIPRGKPFLSASLRRFASVDNVRQILSRMSKSGEIQRIAKGIFVRPKKIKHLKNSQPSVEQILESISELTGEIITTHGAEAARKFQLTTQVPMQPIFYTTGSTRNIKLAKITIQLIHINHNKLIAPNTKTGLAISALWFLGKETATLKTIYKIKQHLSDEEFNALFSEVERIPSWMANLFYNYQKEDING